MVLGYIYSVTGRYRLAEFEFTKVSELGLQSSQALAALGFVYYAQKKVPESIETLKKALEMEPKNPNALNSLGFIYAEEKIDPQKAVSLCRQAVEAAPRNAAYLDSLGWALFRLGSLDEARSSFRRALDLAPGNREIAAHMRDPDGGAEERFDSLAQPRKRGGEREGERAQGCLGRQPSAQQTARAAEASP